MIEVLLLVIPMYIWGIIKQRCETVWEDEPRKAPENYDEMIQEFNMHRERLGVPLIKPIDRK